MKITDRKTSLEHMVAINELINLVRNYIVLSRLYDSADVTNAVEYYIKNGSNFNQIYEYLKYNVSNTIYIESIQKRDLTSEAELCDIYEKSLMIVHNTLVFREKYKNIISEAIEAEAGYFYMSMIRMLELMNDIEDGTIENISETFGDSPYDILIEEDRIYSMLIDRVLSENYKSDEENYYKLLQATSNFGQSKDIETVIKNINDKLIFAKDFDTVSEKIASLVKGTFEFVYGEIVGNVSVDRFYSAYKNIFDLKSKFVIESEVKNIISKDLINEEIIKKFITVFLPSFVSEADDNYINMKNTLVHMKESVEQEAEEIKTVLYVNINELTEVFTDEYKKVAIAIGKYLNDLLLSVIPKEEI